jgi:DNA-binding IclR family transcriptional regulator
MTTSLVSSTDAREASSIEKVLLTLLAFETRSRWTLHELAEHLALPKSSVHRFLAALVRFRFVQQDRSGQYYLGYRTWAIAQNEQSFEFLRVLAQPILEKLVSETRETAFLSVRSGLHSLCIARVNTPQEVQLLIKVGTASPLHLGASNTVLLAFMPVQERTAIIKQTVLDPQEQQRVEDEMALITRNGYAFSSSQLTPGAAAIGVPVFDANDRLVAALSIGAPAYRLTHAKALSMLPALQDAASKLQEGVRRLALQTQSAHIG